VLHIIDIDEAYLTSPIGDHQTTGFFKTHSSQVSDLLEVATIFNNG
jgi:hypothetical protein